MRHPIYVKRLAAKCASWGGELRVMPPSLWRGLIREAQNTVGGLEVAPFDSLHGVDWGAKVVYAVDKYVDIGAVIHEMGHVFASMAPPNTSTEFDFFGWEVALARELGCYRQWSTGSASYSVTGAGDPWASQAPQEKRQIIRERHDHARLLGLLDKRGNAIAIR